MKKNIYIGLFVVLGFLFQFLVHAVVERWYIIKLVKNFEVYSLGFSWEYWFLIHNILTGLLLVAGVAIGFWQGRYWWQKIYVEKKFRKRKRRS